MPWSKPATACISLATGPRDPVEPAMITGPFGGWVAHKTANRSAAMRGRAGPSWASMKGAMICKNCWVRAQCSEWPVTSRAESACATTPSSCISSTSRPRLCARSNRAARGARLGCVVSNRSIRRASSNCRPRALGAAGRSDRIGCWARSDSTKRRGRKVAVPWANASVTRRRMRWLFRNSVTCAMASGG